MDTHTFTRKDMHTSTEKNMHMHTMEKHTYMVTLMSIPLVEFMLVGVPTLPLTR